MSTNTRKFQFTTSTKAIATLFAVLIAYFAYNSIKSPTFVGTWKTQSDGSVLRGLYVSFNRDGGLEMEVPAKSPEGLMEPGATFRTRWSEDNGTLTLNSPVEGLQGFKWSIDSSKTILTLIPISVDGSIGQGVICVRTQPLIRIKRDVNTLIHAWRSTERQNPNWLGMWLTFYKGNVGKIVIATSVTGREIQDMKWHEKDGVLEIISGNPATSYKSTSRWGIKTENGDPMLYLQSTTDARNKETFVHMDDDAFDEILADALQKGKVEAARREYVPNDAPNVPKIVDLDVDLDTESAVTMSHDGRYAVSISSAGNSSIVKLYDSYSGRKVKEFKINIMANDLIFSPNDAYLLAVDKDDNTVKKAVLVDMNSCTQKSDFDTMLADLLSKQSKPKYYIGNYAGFVDNGNAVQFGDQIVNVAPPFDRKRLSVMDNLKTKLWEISDNGQFLAEALGVDAEVDNGVVGDFLSIWNINESRLIEKFGSNDEYSMNSMDISSDGNYVAFSGQGPSYLYDVKSKSIVCQADDAPYGKFVEIILSGNSNFAAINLFSFTCRGLTLWKTRSPRTVSVSVENAEIQALNISHDGKRLLCRVTDSIRLKEVYIIISTSYFYAEGAKRDGLITLPNIFKQEQQYQSKTSNSQQSLGNSNYSAIPNQVLSYEAVSGWSDELIQLTINEMLARHHYPFKPNSPWKVKFSAYLWYKPIDGLQAEEIYRTDFSDVERKNYDLLTKVRNLRK